MFWHLFVGWLEKTAVVENGGSATPTDVDYTQSGMTAIMK